jgi:CubicO group peptidase (beta-lactamase class C family)
MVGGVRAWLVERFAGLVAEHDVPGAAVAVLVGDDIAEAASGVLNTATGVAATTNSVFQLASVTKLWTATLVMQLVDEGLLDLDRPVRAYLPRFRMADEHASATVTPLQLLSHTAGFDADVVTETTNGDDAIARFVDDYLPTVGQLFAPGEHYSYNNSGYSLLGRIVEVLRGKPYRQVLREHLLDHLACATSRPGPMKRSCSAPRSAIYRPEWMITRHRHVRGGCRTPTSRRARCWPCQRMTCSSSPGCTCGMASRPTAPGWSRDRAFRLCETRR